MTGYPGTLKFFETIASERDREEAIIRKSTGFRYFLLIVPFMILLPFILVHECLKYRSA